MRHDKPIFPPKDFKQNILINVIKGIGNLEHKKQLIKNWQKSIVTKKINTAKEEELQADFLYSFFGEILEYSYQQHEPNTQLRLEVKTKKDQTKADGALGYFVYDAQTETLESDVRVVIELKEPYTDLDKKQNRKDFKGSPVEQAFTYANKFDGKSEWIIVSDFVEIRLYHISNSDKYELFKITELFEDLNLAKFFFIFHKDRLFLQNQDSPIKMLFNEKRAEEIKISNEFYNGYRDNRETLFFNILRKNPTENPFELLSATQKLMDRLVFICFVRDAIPMIDVLADARKILLLRHGKKDTKLWEAVQETFVSFDEGYVPNIPQFNGGLFKPDALIDRLVIKDDILLPVIDFLLLYDFQSQLNVSILGHIFEQSIADLEELRGEIAKLLTPAPPLSGGDFATSSMSFAPLPEGRCDVSQGQGLEDHISTIHNNISKRKKDGIFYTPDYVTKYMLQQTIGEWLEEKKQALLQKHETENADFWADYETVLKSITVLDPACGSGAFLTAVFDYLWAEWKIVINAGIKLGTKKELYRKEEWQLKKAIVLNNIFGVDLNMESVEITKLALWLQTASAYEPLSDLSGNVKRGNSLIDDASITEWAFDWQKEFPQVFAKQGFDVVVGNPPYGAYLEDKQQDYLRKNYKSSEYQLNSYSIFYEKALSLLTKNAYLGFITPNTFTYQHYFGKIRAIFDNFSVQAVTKHQYQVFPDADIGDTVSWIMKNAEQREQVKVRITKSIEDEGEIAFTKVSFAQFRNSNGTYNTGNLIALQKLCLSCVDLGELVQIIVGIKAYEEGAGKPKQTRDTVDKKPFTATKKVNNTYLPCVNGKDFHRYTFTQVPPMFLSYGEWLAAPRTNAPFFEEEKIIVRQTADSLICHLDTHKYINLNNVYNIAKPVENIALKYILALLNSKLMNFIYQSIAQEKGKLFAEVKKVYLEKLPIKIISLDEQQIFVEKVSSLLDANQQLFRIQKDFLDLVESNFGKDKFTKKLEKWFELDWNTLSDEFEKSKIKLSLKQQKQWKAFFEEEQPQATKYVEQITQTDQEIDNLVYKLYELSAEEIEMIEKL